MSSLQPNYSSLLEVLKARIGQARVGAAIAANRELLLLYWEIGKTILEQQQQEGWGAKVIGNLSRDLRIEFPDFKGLSERNLGYMKAFAEAYPDLGSILQPLAAKLPEGGVSSFLQPLAAKITWTHHKLLLDRVKDLKHRQFYMEQTVINGWSTDVLALQIESRLHERQGKAISNFSDRLPSVQSDLAEQTIKNSYLFDFFALSEKMRERDIEKALVEHLKDFMLALGKGFAFVGNQVNLNVDGSDFFLDLLFFNYHLNCFVVFELKVGNFKPEHAGKLNFYVNAVNGQLKGDTHQPTIGVLLCKTPNETVVKYSLQGVESPIGVANYELAQALPKELTGEIPTVEELEAEIEKGIEELKSPSQKRLDALKGQLAERKGDQVQTKATYEILCSIFDQSLKPLYVALLESLKELEPLFFSHDYWWTGPNNLTTLEQVERYWKEEELLKSSMDWDFNYTLRGLKAAGTDAFDAYLNLRYHIDTYNFNFSIINRNNQERFLKKQYHEQLTPEDIQNIIEACREWLVGQIEQGLERLKK